MRLLRVLLATYMIVSIEGCKPQSAGSDVQAIVSNDGMQAFGLIPMRNYAPPLGDDYTFEDSRRIANALRTVFGAVECLGKNAALQVNILEGMAAQNAESVRRDRDKIILMDDVGSLQFGCKVIGTHTLSIGSFTALFAEKPKNQKDFEVQQAVWLAARGRSDPAKAAEFSAGFYDFLYEGLGAFPASDKETFNKAIANLDKRFNPCVSGDGEFDKRKAFRCDKDKNYRVNPGQYAPVLKRFLSTVTTAEKSALAALKKLDTKNELDGFETAILVRSNIADMNIKASLVAKDSAEDAESPPTKSDTSISPLIRVLASRLGAIESIFAIRVGSRPGEVYSISNPLSTNQPPQGDAGGFDLLDGGFGLVSAAGSQQAATAAPGEWQRTGNNTFQRKLPNGQYETSVATKNSNGQYTYNNSTWNSSGNGGWARQNSYPYQAGIQRTETAQQQQMPVQKQQMPVTGGQPATDQYKSPDMSGYQTQNQANLGKDPYTWQRLSDTTFQRQLENGRWETASAHQKNGKWDYNKATWESQNGQWQQMKFDEKGVGSAVQSNPFGQRSQGDIYNADNNQCGDMARNSAQYMQRYYGGETKMIHYTQARDGSEKNLSHAMTAWRPNGSDKWVIFDAQTQKYQQVSSVDGPDAKKAVAQISSSGYYGKGEVLSYGTKSDRTAYGRSNDVAQTGWNSPVREKVLGGYWLGGESEQ